MRTLFAALLWLSACAVPQPLPLLREARELDTEVHAVLAPLGPGVRAAVWLGAPGAPPSYAWNGDLPMPTASAIKAAYLVELFAEHTDALDAPFPDAGALLADADHPAVRDYRPAQRAAAAQALGKASVRQVAEAMITGKGVDNATYNLAANLVTARCGGPAWLQARLHGRDPAWQGLWVRRYMLASRTEHGDNEATARALAAVHGALAAGRVPGVADGAVQAARQVLAQADDHAGRHRFGKGGALDSDPVTRVRAGWREGPTGTVVHVVMLAQDGVAAGEQAAAGQRLGEAAREIEERLLAAVR